MFRPEARRIKKIIRSNQSDTVYRTRNGNVDKVWKETVKATKLKLDSARNVITLS